MHERIRKSFTLTEECVPFGVVGIPIGLVVTFITLRHRATHPQLLIRTPEKSPAPLQQIRLPQSSKCGDGRLSFGIQQSRVRVALLWFVLAAFRNLRFLFLLLLLALHVHGGCEDHVNDLVHLGVLEWMKKLPNLDHGSGIIRFLLDLHELNEALNAYEPDVPCKARATHLSLQRAGVLAAHND